MFKNIDTDPFLSTKKNLKALHKWLWHCGSHWTRISENYVLL